MKMKLLAIWQVLCLAIIALGCSSGNVKIVDSMVDASGTSTQKCSIENTDNVIHNLMRSGEVCRINGEHVWNYIPHVTLEYRPDGNYPEHRKCRLCGKDETKEPGAWK